MLVFVFVREVYVVGGSVGGDNDGVGGVGFVGVEFGGKFEGVGGEVEVCYGVGYDFGVEVFGLGVYVVLGGC